jgi:hypothetical protein
MDRAVLLAAAGLLSLLAAPAHAADLSPCPDKTATQAPCEQPAPPCPRPEAPCQR